MYVYLAIALLSAALSGAGAWRVQNWRHDAQEHARMVAAGELKRKLERGIDAAAVGHEKDKRKSGERFKTIDKEVEHVITQGDFYGSDAPACFNDDGMRQLAAAVAASAAASEPARAVQPSERSRWPWTRRDTPVGD